MRKLLCLVGGTLAGLAAVGILGIGQALAFQTTITEIEGIVAPGGIWTRTISDVSEPNGPSGSVILVSYNVVVNYPPNTTDVQLANLYKTACESTLPGPSTGPNGYGVVFDNPKRVRLSKQNGSYNFSDAGLPSTVTTHVPSTSQDAPLASPAGLALLLVCLSVIAWWTRRQNVPT